MNIIVFFLLISLHWAAGPLPAARLSQKQLCTEFMKNPGRLFLRWSGMHTEPFVHSLPEFKQQRGYGFP